MIREFEIKYAILFLYIYHQANLLKKFETFADNLELNLNTTPKKKKKKKKNLIVLLGDLTAKNVNSTKMIARLMKILKLTTLHCNLECNS